MGQLISIPGYKLLELYRRKRLSIRKIAKLYNCDARTIHRKLLLYNIKTRSPSEAATKIFISKSKLKYYYIHKKLSTHKIAKIYNCDDFTIFKKLRAYEVKIRTKSEAISKYKKYNFNNNIKEKAYMIGFRLGDLYVERIYHLIIIRCSSTYQEQIKLIKNLFIKYGHIRINKTNRLSGERNIINICCHLNESFEFLLPKIDEIPGWIRQSRRLFLPFLAGYTDAEGWIGFYNGKYGKRPKFQIATYDKNILKQIWANLQKLKIVCPEVRLVRAKSKEYRQNKDCWRLDISRHESLLKVLNLLEPYIKHLRKRSSIKKVKLNITQRLHARNFIYH